VAILFVGGVMNVCWIAALTAFALVEKIAPAGRPVSWIAGAVLTAGGVRLRLM
jgi:predicted metal-binding membrane protein